MVSKALNWRFFEYTSKEDETLLKATSGDKKINS